MIGLILAVIFIHTYQICTGAVNGFANWSRPGPYSQDAFHWWRNGQGVGFVGFGVSAAFTLVNGIAPLLFFLCVALAWIGGNGIYNRILWWIATGNWEATGFTPGQPIPWWGWTHKYPSWDWAAFGICTLAIIILMLWYDLCFGAMKLIGVYVKEVIVWTSLLFK